MTPQVRERLLALFFCAGSGFLFTRTIIMIAEGNLVAMVPWAAALLALEALVDCAWLVASLRWLITLDGTRLALRLAAAGIMVHAVRVAVYVFSSVGPWIDFDRRPGYKTGPPETLVGSYILGAVALVSVVVVIVVWRVRKRRSQSR